MALHYNLDKVYELSDNDANFAHQIVHLFINEVPKEVKTIKNALKDKDYNAVYNSAHKIKPSLDLLGMDLSYDETILIMNWAKNNGKKKEIKEVLKSLKNRLELAIKEIKKDYHLA